VREGKFDAQIRAMAPYRPASDFWRKVLVEPSTAPEAALERGFLSSILANLLPGICAALALALFLVVMNQAGLGATLAALAANAGFAFVLSMLASNFSPSSYGDEYTPYYLTWSVAAFAILAPLALVALALWRRVRTRTTALFGAASVWAATIWLPIAIASYWSYRLRIEAAPQALPYLVLALPLLIVALARLVQSMLTRASRLPLAQ
jgi:hypothetical protein